MTAYIALLKAVNVGGTGKMPMSDLKALCEEAGFDKVRTYIASGNVVFTSRQSTGSVKALMEEKTASYFGKPAPVFIRTVSEMKAVLDANPFKAAAANRVIVSFLDTAPPNDLCEGMRHHSNEEIAGGKHEFYVHYPEGQGPSKLTLPAQKNATGRNINTVTNLIKLADNL